VRRWIDGDKALPVSRLRRTSSVIVATAGVLS
jgi:hypothetical protein